ncbi:Alpha/Beta hydrolase protein [Mucor lusitanicus]|uniref:Alpha/Beta hydrolase protein n=1 Tax=Mucor circinelloides f. lusitanicus TaxID=29924 RepID=A0A8H4F6R5_MUCCL|nr:Alpha/Beta hydrolase protein [Mucor lusitanicus]
MPQQTNNGLQTGQAPWRVALATWLFFYLSQNILLLVGLNAPDPLSRLYKRSFYRATWILTALDAGFFTAMPFKPLWLRHVLSLVFSAYYLVFADSAEEKVRKTRSTISIEQMRTSWEKVHQNPILGFVSSLLRPRLSVHDIIHVDRPSYSSDLPHIEVYRYYTNPSAAFADHDTILLQFPGGGFVSMPPPCHEDALAAWAKHTGFPVFSVNYKKAPEYPYPWPIEECFDLYISIIQSNGRVLGLSGEKSIQVIFIGDSAGGNITAAVTLKILAHNQQLALKINPTATLSSTSTESIPDTISMTAPDRVLATAKNPLDSLLPVPIGLILIYPALDFEMSCWMSPSQLSLIRAESNTALFRSSSLDSLWQTKDHLSHASPLSVVPDLEKKQSLWRRALGLKPTLKQRMADRAHPIRDQIQTKEAWATARLAMTSRMSFFNDRVITPDLMRAMAILYLGPHASPDFENDYLLSPVHAPEDLLAHFPKTYMMCGEKDPLVDDTVIFAGRIRQAKRKYRQDSPLDQDYPTHDGVRVKFLEGMSHAFLQMMPFLPEAHQATKTIGDWVVELANTSHHVKSDHHVAEIITSEKDMIHRRKQQLVKGLY